MNVSLRRIELREKQFLSDMLDQYLKELSEYKTFATPYKYLDNYFQEPNRHPLFILVDDVIAGFVLANTKDPLSDGKRQTISEFYVTPTHRNEGVGSNAAKKALDMFPGEWVIRELVGNPAVGFWEKVVKDYTNGNFQEIERNDEKWKGKEQIFNNSL